MKKIITVKKIITQLLLICILVFATTSCSDMVSDSTLDNMLDHLEKFADKLDEFARASYTIGFDFADINDRTIIEQRLVAMNCSIEESNQNGEYKISSSQVISEEWLDFICSNNTAALVDESDTVFISKEDIINSRNKGRSIIAEISAEFFNSNYETYYGKDYYIKTEDGKFPAFVLIEFKDGVNTIWIDAEGYESGTVALTDIKKALISLNLVFASSPLNGEVKATIISVSKE